MRSNLREGSQEINAAAAFTVKPQAVRAALDLIRPGLLADGGNVELLSVEEDGTVRIELQGACETCPSQSMTLCLVLEPYLKDAVKGVTGVVVS
jgi:Fe-S cluster biogenesis protein NfuA